MYPVIPNHVVHTYHDIDYACMEEASFESSPDSVHFPAQLTSLKPWGNYHYLLDGQVPTLISLCKLDLNAPMIDLPSFFAFLTPLTNLCSLGLRQVNWSVLSYTPQGFLENVSQVLQSWWGTSSRSLPVLPQMQTIKLESTSVECSFLEWMNSLSTLTTLEVKYSANATPTVLANWVQANPNLTSFSFMLWQSERRKDLSLLEASIRSATQLLDFGFQTLDTLFPSHFRRVNWNTANVDVNVTLSELASAWPQITHLWVDCFSGVSIHEQALGNSQFNLLRHFRMDCNQEDWDNFSEDWLPCWPNLATLVLYDLRLWCPSQIVKQVGQLTALQTLHLVSNARNWTSLIILDLLQSLPGMPQLASLVLPYCALSNTDPFEEWIACLTQCTALTGLHIALKSMDHVSAVFSTMTQLQVLSLEFDGEMADALQDLVLQSHNICRCRVTSSSLRWRSRHFGNNNAMQKSISLVESLTLRIPLKSGGYVPLVDSVYKLDALGQHYLAVAWNVE